MTPDAPPLPAQQDSTLIAALRLSAGQAAWLRGQLAVSNQAAVRYVTEALTRYYGMPVL
jgi:hypothetical protein